MEMLAIVGCSAVILTIAYFTYGRLLSRLFLLDDRTPTPANTLRDDVDYVPCETAPLLSQHSYQDPAIRQEVEAMRKRPLSEHMVTKHP